MLDRRRAERADPLADAAAHGRRPARQRALVACAALALALHAVFIGSVGRTAPGSTATGTTATLSVRTVLSDTAAAHGVLEAPTLAAEAVPALAAAMADISAAMPATSPAQSVAEPHGGTREAPTRQGGASLRKASLTAPAEARADFTARPAASIATAEGSSSAPVAPTASLLAPAPEPELREVASSTAAGTAAAPPTLLSEGEQPPPLYRTQVPASATLRYQVRRGLLRGTGEIRWRADGESYSLALEARFAGVPLLRQTSQGALGIHGLSPVRFLDQRARRAPQAANFRRDDERITFSGSSVEWPLLGGSQDRLSWMIQLAGIAAADPQLLVEGGRIAMVVVGARGDAAVWTLRCAGREAVDTAAGPVQAIKLVRDARSAYDTSAEIWLDPARAYLPARATLRNSSGASEYELLLEGVDPG